MAQEIFVELFGLFVIHCFSLAQFQQSYLGVRVPSLPWEMVEWMCNSALCTMNQPQSNIVVCHSWDAAMV